MNVWFTTVCKGWWGGSNINERESGHQGTGEGRAYESSRLNLNYSN